MVKIKALTFNFVSAFINLFGDKSHHKYSSNNRPCIPLSLQSGLLFRHFIYLTGQYLQRFFLPLQFAAGLIQ